MRSKRSRLALCLVLLLLPALACQQAQTADPAALQAEVKSFLKAHNDRFVELLYAYTQVDWEANTRIVEGDDGARQRVEAANEAFAAFTGSTEVINTARAYLERADELGDLERRQLEVILYGAADNPQTVPELVKERIAAEALQNEELFGFEFQVDGRPLSTNDLDEILVRSTDPAKRLAAWEASKEVGKGLKSGLSDLVRLRNGTSQALGYEDFFAYQVADYGMSSEEMMALNRRFVEELWPLSRELHTWARHELAARFEAEVPELLPAHWLPNRWGQDWAALVKVEGIDLDGVLAEKSAEWVVEQAEDFYVSLGFDPMPQSFWEKSSLYPLPADADYKKNNHASAWHLNRGEDVRSLMSVVPDERWWATTHHELGHIYYYMSYTRPEVPPLLRRGANRGFHEAVGTLMGIASMQKPFLEAKGLIPAGVETDEIQSLLKEALDTVVFIPFSAGTMTHFEHDLYANDLSVEEYNERWWQYVRGFQGIAPPEDRGEEYCDAASKTHINNDPAQYYDYAVSSIILHQLHAHIAREILGQDPRATNYFGQAGIGEFLGGILEVGATEDWREVMRRTVGEEISAEPMLRYFEPLLVHLKEVNQGRVHSLPDSPAI